ncbi:MAG: peroxiredoxin [Candidatus Nanopelagicales bacterium]
MSPAIGQPAPGFDLPASTGKNISLASLRGSKVVLQFFPFAFTGICTGELCDLRDRSLDFQADDALVLGVSCDSRATLAAFAKAEDLQMPLLSDFWPHGAVAGAYGVFLDTLGAANRGTFIIDADGILRWSVVTGLGEPRDTTDYLKALAEIG